MTVVQVRAGLARLVGSESGANRFLGEAGGSDQKSGRPQTCDGLVNPMQSLLPVGAVGDNG